MRQIISLLLVLTIVFTMLGGCAKKENNENVVKIPEDTETGTLDEAKWEHAVTIQLDDEKILVDGQLVSANVAAAVYIAKDIVYYEDGKDFTYGEGTEVDAHSQEEAAAHTVVHITQPGQYVLSGTLSAGQIAVDLGEDAEEDPNAVVTLILNGLDITCTVAPAVIFYNVYECGEKDNPVKDVDTSAAGANVIITDGSNNMVNGSYVARIYKPDSVELSEDGTEVADAKKLHKYDAAFYSKMSMNINGEEQGSGILKIKAENEGLDSELHLTINSGNISIESGNDGINTNEDGVSVTTINGGHVIITVTGETGEGDGIDSNGWLVINGGKVVAAACANSADSGIDSDMGIHINGGTVIATGHMLDRIEDGSQTYVVVNFTERQSGDKIISLRDESDEELIALWPINDYSILIYSSPELEAGDYTLWSDETQLSGFVGEHRGIGGFGAGMHPGGMMPDGQEPPSNMERPDGMRPPERLEFPENITPPENMTPPQEMDRPRGGKVSGDNPEMAGNLETTSEFTITEGGNYITIWG